jgi:tRNA-dihydrouridine synthase B
MPFPYPVASRIPLFLAPMAGVSESPFRRLCRSFGADVVVTEFLSAEGIRRENDATLSKLRFGPDERPIGVQIFGADAQGMGEAAAIVTDVFAPEFIDINFGCPVKKVVKRNGGSGCLKDLDLVESVIRTVVSHTHLPVTVKIRSGWSEEMRDPVSIARRCEDAGARALTLHPRTRAQMYSGDARWDEIGAVVDALEIPVIGNGDIKTPADAARMHAETGCAGVMVARGSFGQPWIFTQARALLDGLPVPSAPPVAERFAVALRHAAMAASYEPDPRGAAIEFRKHLGWYVKGLPGSANLRRRLHAVESLGEVEGLFADYLAHVDEYAEADAVLSAT